MSDTATESVPRTFAVGDRVRYHGVDRSTTTPVLEGHIGTVRAITSPSDVQVAWDTPPAQAHSVGILPINLEPYSDDASDSEPRQVAVGDRLRITQNNPHGARWNSGDTIQVTDLTVAHGPRWFRAERVTDSDTLDGTPWILNKDDHLGWEFLPVESVAMIPDEAVLPGMESLEVERLRRELAEAQAKIAGMENDVAVIGEMFGRAAVKENLCGVYERTVDRVNERLTFISLEASRPEPTSLTATRRRRVTVWVTESGSLECAEHDDDCDHDEDDFDWDGIDTSNVVEAARNDFDDDNDTDDFEYEVSD